MTALDNEVISDCLREGGEDRREGEGCLEEEGARKGRGREEGRVRRGDRGGGLSEGRKEGEEMRRVPVSRRNGESHVGEEGGMRQKRRGMGTWSRRGREKGEKK